MKTDELKAQGLTDEQIAFVMAENGKDIKKAQKDLEDITADRDAWKTKAETSEDALKSFDGIKPDEIKNQLAEYEKKMQEAEAKYKQDLADRDFNSMLKDAITEAKGKNAKAITSLLDIDALKNSKNQKEDVANAIKSVSESDSYLFDTSDNAPKPAKFTQPSASQSAGANVTKESIMQIKDRAERLNAIAQNKELFMH